MWLVCRPGWETWAAASHMGSLSPNGGVGVGEVLVLLEERQMAGCLGLWGEMTQAQPSIPSTLTSNTEDLGQAWSPHPLPWPRFEGAEAD